ncbi:hypothetical protein POX_e06553 [Penicillium oxalicum]|nr:hypothetical protein POX_e06553 [Penicillium oxalicum]KAI2788535.1 hypothetical protein POX_e06553 [Penicillium oxalicum]
MPPFLSNSPTVFKFWERHPLRLEFSLNLEYMEPSMPKGKVDTVWDVQ